MANDFGEALIPEIWETEEDKNLSINKLREKYIEYARSHFLKSPYSAIENQDYCKKTTGQVFCLLFWGN